MIRKKEDQAIAYKCIRGGIGEVEMHKICESVDELYGKEARYCSDRKEVKDHGADAGQLLGSSLADGDYNQNMPLKINCPSYDIQHLHHRPR
jgi:hypothetical protein